MVMLPVMQQPRQPVFSQVFLIRMTQVAWQARLKCENFSMESCNSDNWGLWVEPNCCNYGLNCLCTALRIVSTLPQRPNILPKPAQKIQTGKGEINIVIGWLRLVPIVEILEGPGRRNLKSCADPTFLKFLSVRRLPRPSSIHKVSDSKATKNV